MTAESWQYLSQDRKYKTEQDLCRVARPYCSWCSRAKPYYLGQDSRLGGHMPPGTDLALSCTFCLVTNIVIQSSQFLLRNRISSRLKYWLEIISMYLWCRSNIRGSLEIKEDMKSNGLLLLIKQKKKKREKIIWYLESHSSNLKLLLNKNLKI